MSTSMPSSEAKRVHSSSVSKSKTKSPATDVSTPTSASRTHKTTNPLHLLPATALFHGPHSRNDSHTSLHRQQQHQRDEPGNRTTPTNQDKPQAQQSQHLPRAHPPTSSFSSPRPLPPLNAPGAVTTPGANTAFQQLRPPLGTIASSSRPIQPQSKQPLSDFHPDAVWAEMQRTLADVELSAMNSSHVFGEAHARALEDLRSAQLGLAQAWAKSEADEMGDDEFGKAEENESVVGQLRGGVGVFGSPTSATTARGGGGRGHGPAHGPGHSRNGSTASNTSAGGGPAGGGGGGRKLSMGHTLEEETERDIRLARRRREANDRYFKQVNRGVLDVVKKLDEVAGAMRRVEKESREIWNESSGSDNGDADQDLGTGTETEEDKKPKTKNQSQNQKPAKKKEVAAGGEKRNAAVVDAGVLVGGADVRTGRPRAETDNSLVTSNTGTGTGTESGFLSDSPQSRR